MERPILFSAPMVRALLEDRKTQTRRIIKPEPSSIKALGVRGALVPYKQVAAPREMPSARSEEPIRCPYGRPGDRLWVREKHWVVEREGYGSIPHLIYDEEWSGGFPDEKAPLRPCGLDFGPHPSVHMPRWTSRLTLEITSVRVERLNDIGEADAIAEGLYRSKPDAADLEWFAEHTEERSGRPPTQQEWDEFNEGVWMAPGARQGWGLTKAERARDQWGPTAQFAYRLVWESINGKGSWAANPWVWVVEFARVQP